MLQDIAFILANSDSEGGLFIFAIPFIAAGGVYAAIYRKYRNKDKRYHFESITDVNVENLDTYDLKVDHRTGMKNSRIIGDNSGDALQRVQHVTVTPR